MTPELWREVESLFAEVNDLPEGQRKAFLDRSGASPEVRREVESLIGFVPQEGRLANLVDEVAAMLPEDSPLSRPLIGRTFGHYRIVGLLGRGGMGEIYAAEDPRLGRQVALKLLPDAYTENPERVRRFQQEARSASALNHPNILTVFDFGQSDGTYYIATELVHGRTLRQIIGQEPISLRELLAIAIQIAGALSAAHSAGIVHRDIKPENVMVRPDGYVKVLDFGLAKLRDPGGSGSNPGLSHTRSGIVMGTVQYMSPEQARGLEIDARSDLFSLGVVLYEMVARRAPFHADTITGLLAAVMEQEPAPLGASAPPPLEAIIRRCLRKNRDERYRTSRELQADLEQLVSQPSLPVPALPRPRRWKWFGIAAAAGVAILAAAFFAFRGFPGGRRTWYSNVQFTKIRAAQGANSGVISPFGRYIAYMSFFPNGQRDLSVRLLTAPSSVRVIPPAAVSYYAMSFSPDENYLYYLVHRLDGGAADTLFRIPVLGGAAQKLIEKATSSAIFSPDGSRILFSQDQPAGHTLVVAAPDGANPQVLAHSTADWAFSGPGWSRDGKSVYYAEGVRSSAGVDWRILELPLSGRAARVLANFGRARIWGLQEVPDGSGFVANAYDLESSLPQIWFVPRHGSMRHITHDLNEYQGLSVTGDGRQILTNQVERESELWIIDFEHPDSPQRITQPRQRFDYPVWTRDGNIVASLAASGASDLWVISPDGATQRQALPRSGPDVQSNACPDRDDVVFTSRRDGKWAIWRVHSNRDEVTQITFGVNDQFPQCMPGGFVVYRSQTGSRFENLRVPIDGGTPAPALDRSPFDVISRDGLLRLQDVADPQTHEKHLAVQTVDGGTTRMSFPYDETNFENWAPDGRGFAYVHRRSGAPEVWYQALAGGPPRQLTHFGGDDIFNIDWSPDGRRIVCARGRFIFDMVFIKDVQ